MPKKTSAKVWGIWTPMPGALNVITLRMTRRACIKEYLAWYGARTKPKLTWAQLYRWGWRCVPVAIQFNKPR